MIYRNSYRKKNILFSFVLLLICLSSNGQSEDEARIISIPLKKSNSFNYSAPDKWPTFLPKSQGWYLDTKLSDEFNAASIDRKKWKVFDDKTNGHNGCCSQIPSTDSLSIIKNGYLTQRANKSPSGRLYTSGMETYDTAYLYGYYEIRAKLPGFIDENGNISNRGFWTAAWLYTDSTRPRKSQSENVYVVYHHEVDFMEMFGLGPNDPDAYHRNIKNGANGQSYTVGCGIMENGKGFPREHTSLVYNLPDLTNSFHKYGVLITPAKITYYFDGIPFKETIKGIPYRKMRMVINNQFYTFVTSANKKWPVNYVIDYFRYYRKK